jgi:ribosomal protein S14
MTFERVRKQIENKKEKVARYDKFNKKKERKFGRNVIHCRKCDTTRGVMKRYGLHYCRRCFREDGEKLGFNKFS